ncbi:hypothetical protein UPYG_G00173920 [Umbra pygmaea]|uniref:Uncharacterized protein n=1 Tax=Umbra pygmaea TaxID=75934 RepID=A0ABD0WTW9_UMBPY
MEQSEEDWNELGQVVVWLQAQGLSPGASVKEQLGFLWRLFQHNEGRLVNVTHDLDSLRARHSAEMAESYLEHLRSLSEQRDVLTQEYEQDNEVFRVQLHRMTLQQDAQMNEVAEMLYQEGLAEIIPCSPSEQVAYLLVERASLLERPDDPQTTAGKAGTPSASQQEIHSQHQGMDQGATSHGQSPWKRLFGLRKAAQKNLPMTYTSVELRPGSDSGSGLSVERELARLERDLEEASRRLAMAHKEIRRLTDELESAHMTQSAYEPELQRAQEEVELLRQEVEKLKKCDFVELRKAKEMNGHLDRQEIRELRPRGCVMDAARKALMETGVKMAAPQMLTVSLQTDLQLMEQDSNRERGLQRSETKYKLDELQHQMQRLKEKYNKLIYTTNKAEEEYVEVKQQREEEEKVLELLMDKTEEVEEEYVAIKSKKEEEERLYEELKTKVDEEKKECECAKSMEEELNLKLDKHLGQSEQPHRRLLLNKDSLLQQQKVDENEKVEQHVRHAQSFLKTTEKDLMLQAEDYLNLQRNQTPQQQDNTKELMEASQGDCEKLKKKFMEVLTSLDFQRSKNAKTRSQHKTKMQRAKQIFIKETGWRDERIKDLERDLAFALNSSTMEKDMIVNMNKENDKLLAEKRDLLGKLNEFEDKNIKTVLAATTTQYRVDFLEKENKHLQDTIVEMSGLIPSGTELQHALKNLKISADVKVNWLGKCVGGYRF